MSRVTRSNPRAPPRPVSSGAGGERREITRENKKKKSGERDRRPRGEGPGGSQRSGNREEGVLNNSVSEQIDDFTL